METEVIFVCILTQKKLEERDMVQELPLSSLLISLNVAEVILQVNLSNKTLKPNI